jgi:FkbM family methyltransferase
MLKLRSSLYGRIPRGYRRRIREYRRTISKYGSRWKANSVQVIKTHHSEHFLMLRRQLPIITNLYRINGAFHYEDPETEVFLKHLTEGDVFIDVGANCGYYTLLAHRKCSQVFAFEPGRQFFKALQINLLLNSVTNATVLNYGLFSENKEAYLKLNRGKIILTDSESVKQTDLEAIRNHDPNFEKVTIRIFDEVREEIQISKVDFLKVDVEGAEVDVLRGMEKTLQEEHPKILLSVHPSKMKIFDKQNQDILNLLKQFKYQFEPIVGKPEGVTRADYLDNYSLYCW